MDSGLDLLPVELPAAMLLVVAFRFEFEPIARRQTAAPRRFFLTRLSWGHFELVGRARQHRDQCQPRAEARLVPAADVRLRTSAHNPGLQGSHDFDISR